MTVIQENSDPVALTAQADIHRFYKRVIEFALAEFTPGPDAEGGDALSLSVFLDKAQAYTHNTLCWEMRRTFGLTIGGIFERQVRHWLTHHAPVHRKEIENARLPKLERLVAKVRGVTLEEAGVANDVHELWRVANAVRHGNGASLKALAVATPKFWSHLPKAALAADRTQLVDDMRVEDADLYRYTLAVMKFWWRAGASSIYGL